MKLFRAMIGLAAIFLTIAYIGCKSPAITGAKVYIQQEEYDKAIEQLLIEVETNPTNDEAFYFLGYCYSRQNKFEEMNDVFNKSLAISNVHENEIKFERTKHWQNNFNRGVRKFQNNEFAEAIADFKTAMIIDPSHAGTYDNLAKSYIRVEDYENAIKALKKALELDSTNVDVWMNYGVTQFDEENYSETVYAMKEVLKLEPTNSKAISNIAISYNKMGQSEKAIEAYNKALTDDPDNMDLYFNRANLYYNKDEYGKAILDYKKVIEQNPEDFETLFRISLAYIFTGDRYLKEIHQLEDEKGNSSQIKDLQEKEKLTYIETVKHLEIAVEINPENPEAWRNLGIVYVRLGMRTKGEEAFAKEKALRQ